MNKKLITVAHFFLTSFSTKYDYLEQMGMTALLQFRCLASKFTKVGAMVCR